jgi:hypothetical protein
MIVARILDPGSKLATAVRERFGLRRLVIVGDWGG